MRQNLEVMFPGDPYMVDLGEKVIYYDETTRNWRVDPDRARSSWWGADEGRLKDLNVLLATLNGASPGLQIRERK